LPRKISNKPQGCSLPLCDLTSDRADEILSCGGYKNER
jgi:hypothetical protein